MRRRIGYMPESCPLYPEMRVVEYLRFRAGIKGLHGRQASRTASSTCSKRCWLDDVRRQLIGTLSKGYRQRVGLADALLADPPVLILDEPTAGLDPSQIRETRELIRELGEKHTVLLSTHILSEVEMTCDHVIIINRGRVAESGPLADLARRAGQQAILIAELGGTVDGAAVRRLIDVDRAETQALAGGVRLRIPTTDPATLAAQAGRPGRRAGLAGARAAAAAADARRPVRAHRRRGATGPRSPVGEFASAPVATG